MLQLKPISKFQVSLDEIVRESGLTINELAEQANISRAHRTKMKKPEWQPTSGFLRKLSTVLVGRVQPKSLAKLWVYGVLGDDLPKSVEDYIEGFPEIENPYDLPGFFRHLPHQFNHKFNRDDLKRRVIIANDLRDFTDGEMLEHTLIHMRNGIEYFYFIPFYGNQKEIALNQVFCNYSQDEIDLIQEKGHFIKSPDFLLTLRKRIDYSSLSWEFENQEGFDVFGNPYKSVLYPMRLRQLMTIDRVTQPVISQIPILKARNERQIPIEDDGSKLKFVLA